MMSNILIPNLSHPLNQGRVAWWLTLPHTYGQGRWIDIIGKNQGSMISMSNATNGWRGANRIGGRGQILFDGSAGYIDTKYSFALIAGTKTATVAIWAYTNTTGVYSAFSDNNNGASSVDAEGCTIFNNAGVFWTRYTLGGSPITASGGTWSPKTWYRVVSTYDGAIVRIYANGTQVGSASGSGSIFSSGHSLLLGVRGNYGPGGSAPWWWPGYLDDISISNRAWTKQEVLTDYQVSQSQYPGVLIKSLKLISIPNTTNILYRPQNMFLLFP